MIAKTEDKRVLRTKRLLRDALTELMEEQGLDRVTVSDLTKRADINRGTFYAHYRDKDDLLMQNEDEIIEDIIRIQQRLCDTTLDDLAAAYANDVPLPFAVALYEYLYENGNFVKTLIGPKGDSRFEARLNKVVAINTVQNVLSEKYRKSMNALVQYYVSYYTAAQLGVIRHWLESGMNESPEEMARIVVAIMFMRPGDAIEMHRNTLATYRAVMAKEVD